MFQFILAVLVSVVAAGSVPAFDYPSITVVKQTDGRNDDATGPWR